MASWGGDNQARPKSAQQLSVGVYCGMKNKYAVYKRKAISHRNADYQQPAKSTKLLHRSAVRSTFLAMVDVCGMIALQKVHAQWWPEGGLCSGVAFIMLLRWEREEVQKVFQL